MIFPKNIIGPGFHNGDIVTFVFNGSELTLRLPIIPINKHTEDIVSFNKDFRELDTRGWGEDDQGNRCEQLVTQSWSFEDGVSLDNIALVTLSVSLVDIGVHLENGASLLNFSTLEKVALDGLAYSFADVPFEEGVPNKENLFYAKKLDKKIVSWLQVKVRHDFEREAAPVAFVPLTNSLFAVISLEVQSLHYAGRTNPYSDELLKQFEFDLFDDFLSHIKIEYSPETIEKINALKTKKSN